MTGGRAGTGTVSWEALEAPTASARLRAVLAAGAQPDAGHVEVLVRRCAVEPDFYVRDIEGVAHPARQRLIAALADVPGPAARRTLAGLTDDADRRVALTAAALLRGHDG